MSCGGRRRGRRFAYGNRACRSEPDESIDDAVCLFCVAGGLVPGLHSCLTAGAASLAELLCGELGIAAQVVVNRLDKLAALVVGQAGTLHVCGDLSGLGGLAGECGAAVDAQLSSQAGVEIARGAHILDGAAKAAADVWRRDGALCCGAEGDYLSDANSVTFRSTGLIEGKRGSCDWCGLNGIVDERRVECAV